MTRVPVRHESAVPDLCRLALRHLAAAGERAAERDLVGVLEVAADREAAREPRHADAVAQPSARYDAVASPVAFGFVARTTSTTPFALRRAASARRCAGARARRRRAARASRRARGRGRGTRPSARARRGRPAARRRRSIVAVAPRVEADRAELLLGEVPALAAEADALLHLADRRRERERLLLRHLQEVEREPLRRAAADAGQARQLRDEVVDGRAEHGRRVLSASDVRLARMADPVSWLMIRPGWQVVASGGAEVGDGGRGRGDENADIFDGSRSPGRSSAGRPRPS